MIQAIEDYLARKVLEDIRENRSFGEKLSRALNQHPLIDTVRGLIDESDISTLMKTASTEGGDFSIAISLLRKFDTKPEVKSFLLDQWSQQDDYNRKNELMWRILDDPDLSLRIHEELYEFIMADFDRFTKSSANWCGGAGQVLKFVQSRLEDTSTPASKAWIYLCVATVSSDKSAVIEWMSGYLNDNNAFNRKVASDMMGKLVSN